MGRNEPKPQQSNKICNCVHFLQLVSVVNETNVYFKDRIGFQMETTTN